MSSSIRGLSRFLTSTAFVAFGFLAFNCSPSGGEFREPTEGGSGGHNSGGTTSKGGSGGTSSNTGGTSETGGSNSGGSEEGGSGGSSKGGSGGSSKGGSGGSSKGGSGGSSKGGSGGTSDSGGSSNTGGTKNSGGTSDTGGSSPPAGGSGGTSSGARKCDPKTASTPALTSTGGLPCPGGLCTVGTYAGYLYVYGDGTSKICAAVDSLCASGNTGAADADGKIWGAGLGFNLDKADPPAAVQLSGTGITYALSAMPTEGMRLQVKVGSDAYCVTLKAASGTVAWTDLKTECWGEKGTKLTAAPKTPSIEFQVTAATAAGNFDFCVKSVSFE